MQKKKNNTSQALNESMNTRRQPTPKKNNSLFDPSAKQKYVRKYSCFRFKSWAFGMTASPNWFSELFSHSQRL